jgi:hypothetical protein
LVTIMLCPSILLLLKILAAGGKENSTAAVAAGLQVAGGTMLLLVVIGRAAGAPATFDRGGLVSRQIYRIDSEDSASRRGINMVEHDGLQVCKNH